MTQPMAQHDLQDAVTQHLLSGRPQEAYALLEGALPDFRMVAFADRLASQAQHLALQKVPDLLTNPDEVAQAAHKFHYELNLIPGGSPLLWEIALRRSQQEPMAGMYVNLTLLCLYGVGLVTVLNHYY